MDNNVLLIVVLISMIVFLIIVFLLIRQNNLKQQLFIKETLNTTQRINTDELEQFKSQVSSNLMNFQNNVTNSMKGDLNQLNETTVDRLSKIENKVNDGLIKGFESTNKSFANVLEQMAKIDEAQQNLKSLSSNIASLQNVLTDKKTRGTFGEVELYSILESVFGNNDQRFQRQYKLSNGAIADAILFAPDPLGKIVIDSKFPLENYNRLYEEGMSSVDIQRVRNDFKKDVVKHIDDIADKYLIPGETAEVAYMFIPAEAVFAEIYGRFDELIQYSYRRKVYLVSPTTLMAYITAIKAIYLGQERNERVVEIQQEFIKLSKEFERFNERYSNVQKDFDKTYKDMQNVSITSDKIVKRFKDIESVKLDETKGITNNE